MATGDLVTLAQARSYLGNTDPEETDINAELSLLISRVSRLVNRYASREFHSVAGSPTRTFAYEGGGILFLQDRTLRSVTSIEIDTDEDTPTTLVANEDYRLMPVGGDIDGVYTKIQMLVNDPVLPKKWREVQITGSWGYASVPADVVEAVLCTIAHWEHSLQHNGVDFGESAGPRNVSFLPTKAKQLLAPYRLISFGGRW